MKPAKPHDSMRGHFAYYLYECMEGNKDVWLLTGDLGFGMLDAIKYDHHDRFINCGASEQAMMDIAVGIALRGKIPFVYSITPFVLYRPFETIRTYIDYENLPVQIVGSGRDRDYLDDGYSHWSEDAREVIGLFPNIVEYWPDDKQRMQTLVPEMISNGKPSFLSLKR